MSNTVYRIKEQGHSKEVTFKVEKLVTHHDGSASVMVLEECSIGGEGLTWGTESRGVGDIYFSTKVFKSLKTAEKALKEERKREEEKEVEEKEMKDTSYTKYHDQ